MEIVDLNFLVAPSGAERMWIMGWTRKSYDALYDWTDKARRDKARNIMLADGLDNVISRLDAAKNMGDWYRITHEAVEAVGTGIVEASANQAEIELDRAAAALGRKGGSAKTEQKITASRENGKKGGRPKKIKTQEEPTT